MVGYVAKAIATLATAEGQRAQIVLEGALPPLVRICAASQNAAVLEHTADALANLAEHDGNRHELVQAGALPPLIHQARTRIILLLEYPLTLVNLPNYLPTYLPTYLPAHPPCRRGRARTRACRRPWA